MIFIKHFFEFYIIIKWCERKINKENKKIKKRLVQDWYYKNNKRPVMDLFHENKNCLGPVLYKNKEQGGWMDGRLVVKDPLRIWVIMLRQSIKLNRI